MHLKFIEAPSCNAGERISAVDTVILHYTGMPAAKDALERMQDAEAEVSAHYMIGENGDIYHLVDEGRCAWHAGVSKWKGESGLNDRSIGIELVNPGHEFGYRDFPARQIDVLILLLKDIVTRFAIRPSRVLGHSDVAPRRKEDPGERFPWKRLADNGLALPLPDTACRDAGGISRQKALEALEEAGYDAPAGDYMAALLAFQRRFCPGSLGRGLDPATKVSLMEVARMHRSLR